MEVFGSWGASARQRITDVTVRDVHAATKGQLEGRWPRFQYGVLYALHREAGNLSAMPGKIVKAVMRVRQTEATIADFAASAQKRRTRPVGEPSSVTN